MSNNRTTAQNVAALLAGAIALAGIVLTVVPIVVAAGKPPGYHSVDALLVAAGVMLLITAVLLLPVRTIRVSNTALRWNDAGGVEHEIPNGWQVSDTAYEKLINDKNNPIGDDAKKGLVRNQRVSALRTMYRGKDNRASTSKCVDLEVRRARMDVCGRVGALGAAGAEADG